LCSIEFIYSKTQYIKHNLKPTCSSNNPDTLSFPSSQSIKEIVQYYNDNNKKSAYIEGLSLSINNGQYETYGSNENSCKDIPENDYVFGYALSKETDHYTNGFQFVWYKICSPTKPVDECITDLQEIYYEI
jgi:hypothetical protein